MFHIASKVLFFLFQPSNFAVFLLAGGLFAYRKWPRAGRWLIAGGLAWIVLAGFLPIGNALVLPLEERFATHEPALPQTGIQGIIILGGFEDGWVTAGRGGLAVNEAAERLTEALRIAKNLPDAKIIFTGGVGELFGGAEAGAAIKKYLRDVGIASDRIVIESASRDTYENAVFTKNILHPAPDDRWLLITSAYHMPRAVGAFRQAGFDVIPFPVDFRTRDAGDLLRPFGNVAAGLQRADLAVKEWIGLLAYRMTGRSSAFFPAP
ncbi:MAG TPA: YdcF family protein [Hyphomicrobium sp.]|jgi:uncharacterized SAM-binding protein YcdF (DUF218 family)|nr:YdcF family protein [Rhizomicrobium sp.]HVX35788.1 YdcF family protein [Hyphomicrobium sp.]